MTDWCNEDRQKIERIAYFKWIDAGKPENCGDQFWREAEEQFRNEVEIIEITYSKKTYDNWGDVGYYYPVDPIIDDNDYWDLNDAIWTTPVISTSYSVATNTMNAKVTMTKMGTPNYIGMDFRR